MFFSEKIKQHALGIAGNAVVSDIRIGLSYTCVLLNTGEVAETGNAGLAATLPVKSMSCSMLNDIPLNGRRASELLEYLTSQNQLYRTIGLATANALFNRRTPAMTGGDTIDALKPRKNDIAGMVGYFAPLAQRLKGMVNEVRIFEKNADRADNLYPENSISDLLPECTIAIITSTTLINNTLSNILQHTKNCRTVALTGASTPLAPQVFKGTGINLLSGSIITDAKNILQTVSQAGGMKYFKKSIEKVNLIL